MTGWWGGRIIKAVVCRIRGYWTRSPSGRAINLTVLWLFSRLWKHHTSDISWTYSLHLLRSLRHPDKHSLFTSGWRINAYWATNSHHKIRKRLPKERKHTKVLKRKMRFFRFPVVADFLARRRRNPNENRRMDISGRCLCVLHHVYDCWVRWSDSWSFKIQFKTPTTYGVSCHYDHSRFSCYVQRD